MINSLTDQKKGNIILDRILVKDQQNIHISTDPSEILKITKEYYEEAFKTRSSNFDLLNKKWKEEYSSKTNIKEEWFIKLMDPVTEEKLNTSLKDLPNGKVSEISSINYEILKKLDIGERKILKEFFSLYLNKRTYLSF